MVRLVTGSRGRETARSNLDGDDMFNMQMRLEVLKLATSVSSRPEVVLDLAKQWLAFLEEGIVLDKRDLDQHQARGGFIGPGQSLGVPRNN